MSPPPQHPYILQRRSPLSLNPQYNLSSFLYQYTAGARTTRPSIVTIIKGYSFSIFLERSDKGNNPTQKQRKQGENQFLQTIPRLAIRNIAPN